jgi:hypothetical protein
MPAALAPWLWLSPPSHWLPGRMCLQRPNERRFLIHLCRPVAAPEPGQLPPAPASPAITTVEVSAVAERIFPGPHPAGCDWRDRLTCPVIDRLAALMDQRAQPAKVGPAPIALFCRCQSVPPLSAQFGPEVTSTGGVAHVTLGALKLDLIMVQEKGKLLVDDTQCTGRGPSTSIHVDLVLRGA